MEPPWSRRFEAYLPAVAEQGYSWQCVTPYNWLWLWITGKEVRHMGSWLL